MIRTLCLALGLLLAASPDSSQDAINKELEDLTGTREITYLELDGKEVPLGDLKEIRRVQQGDRITWKRGDQTEFEVEFKINLKDSPKSVDSTYLTGPNKGKTHLGIYQLDGDDFTMCFASFDKPRPTQFATTPQSGLVLYKAKRVDR